MQGKLSGLGSIVEIDESLFSKRKKTVGRGVYSSVRTVDILRTLSADKNHFYLSS